jgi:hypothetical protein
LFDALWVYATAGTGSLPLTATTHVSIALARLAVLAFLLLFVVFKYTSVFLAFFLAASRSLGCRTIFCVSCSVLAQPAVSLGSGSTHTHS